ncbi:hypothetical protein GVAV_000554 [Gurleya vavrai]
MECLNKEKEYLITVKLNIKNCKLQIKDHDTIFADYLFKSADWLNDLKILDFYKEDFVFELDIYEMKFFKVKEQIQNLMEFFLTDKVLKSELNRLLSYKNFEAWHKPVFLDKNILIDDEFLVLGKISVEYFVKYVINNADLCDKEKGLLLSYFFVLCPGLIEVFDWHKFEKEKFFYYIYWIKSVSMA